MSDKRYVIVLCEFYVSLAVAIKLVFCQYCVS